MRTKTKKLPKILLFVSLVVTILLVVWWYTPSQKEKEAQAFIGQIINSVLEDTKFYRDNSDEDVIAELEDNRNLMSDNYTISTIDYSWGIYEAKISFDNENAIKVDVSFRDNKPFLSHFRRLKK